jgi:hypothetical protein
MSTLWESRLNDPVHKVAIEALKEEEIILGRKGEGLTSGCSLGRFHKSAAGHYNEVIYAWWSCRSQSFLDKKQFAHARHRDMIRRRKSRRIIRNAARLARFQQAKKVNK